MRVRWLLAVLLGAPALGSGDDVPTLDEILSRALERQALHEDAGHEVRYDYVLSSLTEKLDKVGEVKESERELYRSHHIDGVAYERLAEKDGRPLTEKEEKKEREREQEFRKKLAEGNAHHNDADERVAFDEDLLARYDITYQETKLTAGRDAFVLAFRPKRGKLPKKSKFDAVLNKASGLLFIDTETYEIARLEFDVKDKVRLWWGMLGSVSRMSGTLERGPVEADIWLPQAFDFYMRGRILFRSLHLRQSVSWDAFEPRHPARSTGSLPTPRSQEVQK